MSSLFKAFNDQERWKTRQQVIRVAYGSLISRNLKNVSYRTTFNQSPDGEYIIVQFESSYQNRASARETVILDCSNGTNCPIREYVTQ
jgi:hypothetical protein